MDGDFSCLCAECVSLDTPDISDIGFLEGCIQIFSDCVTRNIDLDASLEILNVCERCFSHDALEHHTSCDGYVDRIGIHDASSLLIICFDCLSCSCLVHTIGINCRSACQEFLFVCIVKILHI